MFFFFFLAVHTSILFPEFIFNHQEPSRKVWHLLRPRVFLANWRRDLPIWAAGMVPQLRWWTFWIGSLPLARKVSRWVGNLSRCVIISPWGLIFSNQLLQPPWRPVYSPIPYQNKHIQTVMWKFTRFWSCDTRKTGQYITTLSQGHLKSYFSKGIPPKIPLIQVKGQDQWVLSPQYTPFISRLYAVYNELLR